MGWCTRKGRSREELNLAPQLLPQEPNNPIQPNPLLRPRIPVPHSHRLVLDRLAVDREAVGCTGFVHAGVALADRLLDIELKIENIEKSEKTEQIAE